MESSYNLSWLLGIENAERFDFAKADESRGGNIVFLIRFATGSFLFAFIILDLSLDASS